MEGFLIESSKDESFKACFFDVVDDGGFTIECFLNKILNNDWDIHPFVRISRIEIEKCELCGSLFEKGQFCLPCDHVRGDLEAEAREQRRQEGDLDV